MKWVCAIALVACGGGGMGGPQDASPGPDGTASGRVCALGVEPDPERTVVASPALDCPSRICLNTMGTTQPLCTAECIDASDCVAAPESPCTAGFTCQAVLDLGPFACRQLCVCSDRTVPEPACPD